jgi:4,5-dihydroxyphthalate decarboxylase
MPDVSLTFAAGSTSRLQPLLDGEIQPKGIALQTSTLRVSDIFWLMPESEPFDVSEMSLTGYLWAIQHGRRWTALPVFPGWVFGCHADSMVNVHAGIARPDDLRGKRLGVPEYAVTAISWIRDAWERMNGLRREDLIWCEERTAKTSHYNPLGYWPPAPIPVEKVPEDKTICDMLVEGEIEAVTRYFGGQPREGAVTPSFERSRMTMQELAAHPSVRWLYPDRKAAALDYFRQVGWPQAIHCVIVKQEVVDRYPWVPQSLMDAFAESAERTRNKNTVHSSFPFPAEEERQVFGPEFSPVGLSAGNRDMMERMLDLSVKDGFMLDNRRWTVEEYFCPGTL